MGGGYWEITMKGFHCWYYVMWRREDISIFVLCFDTENIDKEIIKKTKKNQS